MSSFSTTNNGHLEDYAQKMRMMTPDQPENIDDLLHDIGPSKPASGKTIWPVLRTPTGLKPAMEGSITGVVGVRVTEALNAARPPETHAATLAALAMEHEAEIVILSHLPYSGYERFGFRVERISGETQEERAACEAQVIAFWDIQVFA